MVTANDDRNYDGSSDGEWQSLRIGDGHGEYQPSGKDCGILQLQW